IAFRSLESKELIGIIINYACHPTSLSFLNNRLSADYPGRIISKINELTKGEVKSIYFNGPSGNYNPITTCGTNYEELERNKSLVYRQRGHYGHTRKIGYTIAEKALELVESIPIKYYLENCKITSYLTAFWIPLTDFKYYSSKWISNKIKFILKKYLIIPLSMPIETNFPKFIVKYNKFNLTAKSVVQVVQFKFSDRSREKSRRFEIVLVPGELYGELGNELLNKSTVGAECSFIFQNINDWIGYLFPGADYREQGGWEAFAGFSPVCGSYIMNQIFKIFNRIQE
ncbi:MAG: hypothetical protein ACW990_00855, partial [Promethearchaeota archaeon]